MYGYQDLDSFANEGSASGHSDDSSVANVLLQILFPLVFVLALAELDARRNYEQKKQELEVQHFTPAEYKEREADIERREAALEVSEKRLNRDRKQLESDRDALEELWRQRVSASPEQTSEQLDRALLELQRQRIVAALERTETARRVELGLYRLRSQQVLIESKDHLPREDPLLADQCRDLAAIFEVGGGQAAENSKLFDRVLAEAGLDPPVAAHRSRIDDEPAEMIDVRQQRLTKQNAEFLRQEVRKMIDHFQAEITSEHARLIQSAFQQYSKAPLGVRYDWNPRLRELRQQLISTSSGKERSAIADALSAELLRKVKSDLESRGYRFLTTAWSQP